MNRYQNNNPTFPTPRCCGVTLVELLVALAIGSFLVIGAVQVAAQSRHAFRINASIARVQETAQFAMDTIETDLRMASNWGLLSRGDAIAGRAFEKDPDEADPADLEPPTNCGASWALDLMRPVEGTDNSYSLPSATCAARGDGGAQANSDTLTIRRATVEQVAPEAGRLQIQTTRVSGKLFKDGTAPPELDSPMAETHDLLVSTYYVAKSSDLIPGVPTLRRKTLTAISGAPTIVDLEVAPGVENMQLQFGIDVDKDNAVDRYVNPGNAIFDPAEAAYIPEARIITARVWLVVRSVEREAGIVDTRDYRPGNVDLVIPDDSLRRLQVSKTILLRNTRT